MLVVLRLSHRTKRDKRVSTHLCLAARAFGADKVVYSGEKDKGLEESISKVVENWGGNFSISHIKNQDTFIKRWKGEVVHLTMYGLPVQKAMKGISSSKDLLVVVGGKKVRGGVYALADFNIAISPQPHSEVSALAVFLHEFFNGKELLKRFTGAKHSIIPQEKGKRVFTQN